ncbi:hypothetical protein BDU57DRAFT_281176 [Ampelomyces quisqualis]|uniref:Uncharacterized protein n=1 Tax=Ampelomyces quisqualis TaxID=50730 RepID=A0A6A5QML0_AMPQU|nr:hypothetical protein BDU57DRAFT_281176 [Ampelomyces quisqualis]
MLTWFYILFLFLVCFSYGLATPISHSSEPISKRVGCLTWPGLWRTLIQFQTDSDPEIEFAIKTGYTMYYPKALKSDLRLSGFRLQESSAECGWQKATSVRVNSWAVPGHHRGDIYWKYRDLHRLSSRDASRSSHGLAESPTHVPPQTGVQPLPNTLETITRILEDNEPAADVFLVTTICLGYLSGFLGLFLILISVIRRFETKPKTKKRQASESIELHTINVERHVQPAPAPKPAYRVACPRGQLSRVLEPRASGQSSPPPQYSVDNPWRRGNDRSSASARLKERYGLAAGRNDRIGD